MRPDAAASLLDAIVEATAAAGSADEVLTRAAEQLVAIADWVFADRLDEPDLIVRVASVDGTGELDVPVAPGATPLRRSAASSLGLLPRVLQAPHHMLRLRRADLEALASDLTSFEGRQAARVAGVGTTELVIVALFRRGQALGVLSLGRQHREFTDAEIAELTNVTAYLSLALDAARLYATHAAVATAVQTHMLPPVPLVAGLRLAARYEPATRGADVGGDWYDVFPGTRGLTLVIGDTVGHDLAAAASMAELRNLLRALAVDRDESPAQTLSRLDRAAFALELDTLATILVSHLEPLGRDVWRFTWSSAGHLPPVKSRGRRAELLETEPELMLGVDRDAVRSDHTIDLEPGDTVLLFTDGLIELPGSVLGDRLEQLRRIVASCGDCTSGELCDRLVDEFLNQAMDDIALLAVDIVATRVASSGVEPR